MMIYLVLLLPASAEEGCLRDGVHYNTAGEPVGCEGGGRWCAGTPTVKGICEMAKSSTVHPRLLGVWVPHGGVCAGSTFTIHADRVAYEGALEPLGTGRILAVSDEGKGVLVRTILEGRGGYLQIWPGEDPGTFDFGIGTTKAASAERYCTMTKRN